MLPSKFLMPSVPSETDFIVVGGGIAGLRAAIGLAEAGRVLVVTKQEVTESNTQYAQGGIAVALSDDDEVEDLVLHGGLVSRRGVSTESC